MTASPETQAAVGTAPSPPLSCPHCGGSQLYDNNPGQWWNEGQVCYFLMRCRSCQGMFTFPTPPPELLDRIYRQDFDYGWYRDHAPAKILDGLHRMWQYFSNGLLTGKRLLDFGGGLGFFATAARLVGYDATTMDPFATGADGPSKLKPGEQFDVVTCHHVLEHARDPGEMIEQLKKLLSPSGTLILALPNGGSQGYKQRGSSWIWSGIPFIHCQHFTGAGLRALCERHDLEVVKEMYFERWDANALSDLRLAESFGKINGLRSLPGLRWTGSQIASAARFLAFAASYVWPNVPMPQRAELLVAVRLRKES